MTIRMVATAAATVALTGGPALSACESMKLYDVSGGSFSVDSALMSAWAVGGETVSLVVPMQVIDHPRGLVIFDTGLADDIAIDGCAAYWGAAMCDYLSLQWTRDDVIDRKLDKLGFAIEDVRFVVYSHFHWDHVANIEMFPEAIHVVQKVELQHAWWPEKLFRNVFVLKDYDETREFDFWEIEGDFDLFGDGCVRLIETPGHTPGHQSLLVRLPRTGPVLLAGDAAFSPKELDGNPPGYTQDLGQSMRSLARIKRLGDVEGADIWIGHDKGQYDSRKQDLAYE